MYTNMLRSKTLEKLLFDRTRICRLFSALANPATLQQAVFGMHKSAPLALRRKSFDDLMRQLDENEELWKDNALVESEIHHNMVELINGPDQDYYMKELQKCNGWLSIYSLIHDRLYYNAVQGVFRHPQYIPNETFEYLCLQLLKNDQLKLFMDAIDKNSPNHFYKVSQNIYEKFIRLCIERRQDDLLAKFIEKYIIYTGDTEVIKYQACHIDWQLGESILNFFYSCGNIKAYSKTAALMILLAKQLPKSEKLARELRFKSRVQKLQMYTDKLGPYTVLENGMFHKFGLIANKNAKFDKHLKPFANSLFSYYKDQQLTLETCILLIEYMHGLHTQEFKESFSKKLNPDIQMARIYRSVIRKTADPDPLILKNYTDIINMANDKNNKHMKDGLPVRRTQNQRFSEEEALNPDDIKPFKPKALQIILYVLHERAKNVKIPQSDELRDIIVTAVLLFQAMIKVRSLKPSVDCVQLMMDLVRMHPATAPHVTLLQPLYDKVKGQLPENQIPKRLRPQESPLKTPPPDST
ncbi:unnamed protein product [Pichia kudriavzevii]